MLIWLKTSETGNLKHGSRDFHVQKKVGKRTDAFESLSRYFDIIHRSICAAPLKVEHTLLELSFHANFKIVSCFTDLHDLSCIQSVGLGNYILFVNQIYH